MSCLRAVLLLSMLLGVVACEPAQPPTPPQPAAIATAAPPAPIPEADLYVLAVGGNGFRADLGLAGLRQRYGADAVVLQDLAWANGQVQPGAVIQPNDASRRAYVYFVDGNVDGPISAIYVRDPQSQWTGPLGVRLGMTSVELARINGRPFQFLGFGGDYGGYISDWTEGILSKAFLEPGRLAVRLQAPAVPEGGSLPADYPSGQNEFASDLPALREQPPTVIEIGLAFVP